LRKRVFDHLRWPACAFPELVEKLYEKRQGFAVIFMSGYANGVALERATGGTEVAVLSKPFSTELLVAKIQEVPTKPNFRRQKFCRGR